MILDLQNRLAAVFAELLAKEDDVQAIASGRYYVFGDASHRAAYPCVLFNVVDSNVSGDWRLGWYDFHYQLLAATYRADDKSKAILDNLVGALRAFAQRTDLLSILNNASAAAASGSALSFRAAQLENDVEDEEEQQGQIYRGISIRLVVAPHTEAETVPAQETPSGGEDPAPATNPEEATNPQTGELGNE